jgi:selenide,water dikinase
VTPKKRVVFAGAGHANIAALRHLAKNPPDAELILVNHGPRIWYTGALPALVRGDLTEAQASIDAAALAKSCGASFIDASIFDFEGSWLDLENRAPLRFDILSLATGATPNGGVKPIPSFLARLKTWDRTPTPIIGIVGAGAAGVELALALRHRLGAKARLTLQSPDNTVLPSAPKAAQKSARQELSAARIQIVTKFPTRQDDLIHAYTPAPTHQIRPTLQLISHDNILAAGDCASFPTPLPRSGAIAVRQGHTLATNIRHLLTDTPLASFKPPRHTLAILSLNADEATAWYGPLSWTGNLPMTLKSRLDTAWVEGRF